MQYILTKYYTNDQIEDDEIEKTWIIHRRNGKCA